MRRLSYLLILTAGCTPSVTSLPEDSGFDPFPLPAFELTERNGDTITKADLKDKVWVAAFVFTRCHGPCPKVSGTMARLQKEFADLDDVRLVTFSVDPKYDTPEVLRSYADGFGADPERWLFLTGDEAQIQEIVQEGFKIHRMPQTDPQAGHTIEHGTKLALIDRDGNVVDYADGLPRGADDPLFEEELREFIDKVKALTKTN